MPIVERINAYCSHSGEYSDASVGKVDCMAQRDIYEFGVYTGRALRGLSRAWLKSGTPCCHATWGFDSFHGLPSDTPAASNTSGRMMGGKMEKYSSMVADGGAFARGAFSVSSLLGTPNITAMVARIEAYIGDPRVHLVPGFFNESLTSELVATRGMRPALYVDIDTDIYISAYQALDWLCANRLITNGTIIGYDDFKWGLATAKGENKLQDGEARAHDEVLNRKWGVKTRLLGKVRRADAFAVVVTHVPW